MKNTQNENPNQGQRNDINKPRPENKDDLDSRERKEDGFKENDNKPEEKEKSKES